MRALSYSHRRAAWLLMAGLVACGIVLFAQREPWRALSGGGEVRVENIAYVETLRYSEPGFELNGLRDWLGPTYGSLLPRRPLVGSTELYEPTFAIVFISRGTIGGRGLRGLSNARCEIDLPGGQTLVGHFKTGYGDITKMVEPVSFPIAPLSSRRLAIRLEVNGETLHLDVKNPAFSDKRLQWKAEPLPQTRTVDDLEITLERVDSEWSNQRGSSWMANAEFSVRRNGKEITDSVFCDPAFCDPLGNEYESALFSEPVWKVICRALKADNYEYSDAEVNWLGATPVPAPGEARLIALTPGSNLSLLALIGPGRYMVADGKITALPAPLHTEASENKIEFSLGYRFGALQVTVEAAETELVAVPAIEAGFFPAILMRDSFGRLPVKRVEGAGGCSLLAAPIEPGTREVQIGLVAVHRLAVEFFVNTPKAPPAEAKPKP